MQTVNPNQPPTRMFTSSFKPSVQAPSHTPPLFRPRRIQARLQLVCPPPASNRRFNLTVAPHRSSFLTESKPDSQLVCPPPASSRCFRLTPARIALPSSPKPTQTPTRMPTSTSSFKSSFQRHPRTTPLFPPLVSSGRLLDGRCCLQRWKRLVG
ncbi:uncharacterized protein MYCFIDRAFT_212772 [Pseudocercospora fijiensis CIRAD86]|uniref:Uncharacterized protein n=1 Tax=Pseudocercospora fijiensis (strain CIRAD86) TaxID=383855 RepID=M3AHY3_PSEFD|nr:uncharacterized protein MYCFIDRAFT_212772 [Pseudocercospora fijiensis CIRAD86]EME76808.1 hypothetical protein MYCFIDRAFT_212772 [Pseudocercospora fijiensis CIRAD86]